MFPSQIRNYLDHESKTRKKELTRKRIRATSDQWKKLFHLFFRASESKAMGKLFNRETQQGVSEALKT